MTEPEDWTPWLDVEGSEPLEPRVLGELLGGGQAFRWREAAPGIWRGTWADCHAEVRTSASGLGWRAPLEAAARVERALPDYLPDFHALHHALDNLPWRSDAVLARALRAFPKLGLLRQPLGETLLGFLCSSTKRIPQIQDMLELLAARFGEPILPGVHALPGWDRLATIPESALRACGLGFRARYVAATARRLADDPDALRALAALPYPECRDALATLPGVGHKVADCTLLFGAGRLEAFPIDTWMLQALRRRYGLDGWNAEQLAQFGRAHFGPLAGLAQQYLFALERAEARSRRTGDLCP